MIARNVGVAIRTQCHLRRRDGTKDWITERFADSAGNGTSPEGRTRWGLQGKVVAGRSGARSIAMIRYRRARGVGGILSTDADRAHRVWLRIDGIGAAADAVARVFPGWGARAVAAETRLGTLSLERDEDVAANIALSLKVSGVNATTEVMNIENALGQLQYRSLSAQQNKTEDNIEYRSTLVRSAQ